MTGGYWELPAGTVGQSLFGVGPSLGGVGTSLCGVVRALPLRLRLTQLSLGVLPPDLRSHLPHAPSEGGEGVALCSHNAPPPLPTRAPGTPGRTVPEDAPSPPVRSPTPRLGERCRGRAD